MEIKMNLEVADMYDLELILFLRKKGIIEEIPNEIEEQEELPEPGQIKIKDKGPNFEGYLRTKGVTELTAEDVVGQKKPVNRK